MNCLDYREQMLQGPTDEARAHLAGCPACANAWNEHLAKHVLAPAAVRDWSPPVALVSSVMAALPGDRVDPIALAYGESGLARHRRLWLPVTAVFVALTLPRLAGLALKPEAAAQSWRQRIVQLLSTDPTR